MGTLIQLNEYKRPTRTQDYSIQVARRNLFRPDTIKVAVMREVPRSKQFVRASSRLNDQRRELIKQLRDLGVYYSAIRHDTLGRRGFGPTELAKLPVKVIELLKETRRLEVRIKRLNTEWNQWERDQENRKGA